MTCPVCQSKKSRNLPTKGLCFRPNQQCKSCGTKWKPPFPKPAAYLSMILGIAFCLFFVIGVFALIAGGEAPPAGVGVVLGGVLVVGVKMLWSSRKVIVGKTGALEVIERGAEAE